MITMSLATPRRKYVEKLEFRWPPADKGLLSITFRQKDPSCDLELKVPFARVR